MNRKRFIVFLFFLLAGMATFAHAKDVKIAVATDKPDKDAAISEVAGRANYFLFFDGKGNMLEAMKNPSAGVAGGAGRNTAELMNKKDARLFFAGKVGAKLKDALKWYKIDYIEQTGAAHEVVKSFLQKQ